MDLIKAKLALRYGDRCAFLSNLYIIRVALNTGFDTACLSGWYTHMTHFGVYHLVVPFSIWPGQGFYVDLFLIDAFPSE